jgi:hypothetical protein
MWRRATRYLAQDNTYNTSARTLPPPPPPAPPPPAPPASATLNATAADAAAVAYDYGGAGAAIYVKPRGSILEISSSVFARNGQG